ncbi:MAG TPA: exonuclease domain-containing protein [Gaiellaceae bacterium]|nr:exonuclease domain-containing protein [Gaiellaceae bacterium]
MQLSFDAADRLVDLVTARGGAVSAADAARTLFALASAPAALARSLLDDVVAGDARLAWRGDAVGLAAAGGLDTPIEEAEWVVFDLETTGLSPATCRICELGAQRVRRLEPADAYATLVDPRVPLPAAVQALTGIGPAQLRGAPPAQLAVRRFLAFAGDAVLVAHNARFDLAFLDREVERLTGRRVAAPVVDTVWLARRLLEGRVRRVGLASLAHLFGTATEPCHRALPDAQATAEVLVRLLGLAQERGARTVGDVLELATPRARTLSAKRVLVVEAPRRPGVYLFRDARDAVLYVGRARDLRTRLRSYFAGGRQRPAVEAALGALARVEWRETGSELEAALAEVRLIRELRPPANARGKGGRELWLRRRGTVWSVVSEPTEHGPLAGTALARKAARALHGHGGDDPASALPALRARMRRLAEEQRFEDAARLRDCVAALERVAARLAELRRLRSLRVCLVAPAAEPAFRLVVLAAQGRVATRRVPTGAGAAVEVGAALAEAHAAGWPEDLDAVAVVAAFVRRPPPEVVAVRLEWAAILAALGQRVAFAA